MNVELIGQASPEQIEAWKKEVKEKYGENHSVKFYKVGGGIAYLRTVDRDTYSLAMVKVRESPAKFAQVVLDKIWLGGDESIRKDDGKYFGLCDMVEDMLNKQKGELGEL